MLPNKKTINYSTALGILFSILLILFIIFYAANNLLTFLNIPGFVIVIAGTIAAIFLSYPLRDVKQGLKSIKLIFFYESMNPQKEADEIIRVAKLWFQRDSIAIENVINSIHKPYLKTAFQLIVDKTPVEMANCPATRKRENRIKYLLQFSHLCPRFRDARYVTGSY